MVKLLMRHFGKTFEPRFDVLNPVQQQAAKEIINNELGPPILFNAAKAKNWNKVRELMEKGVKDIVNPDGFSALGEIVKLLIKSPRFLRYRFDWALPFIAKDFDIYQKDESGAYYLPRILGENNERADFYQIIEFVLKRNTNPEQKQNFLNQLVKEIENKGVNPRALKVMIEHGAPLDMKSRGQSALYEALYYSRYGKDYCDIAHFMIDRGAKIDETNKGRVLETIIGDSYSSPHLKDIALAKKVLEQGATFDSPQHYYSVNSFCQAYGATGQSWLVFFLSEVFS